MNPAERPGESYRRPSTARPVAETEVKRSRFIALAARTDGPGSTGEDAARSFLAEVRASYPDARHHCSAYVLHVDGANPVERSSDDGEPSGTAGQPMLEVLSGSGLQDIAVVVVRYFGGVKLGTGGLVRAYQDATRAVLDKVDVVSREPRVLWTVDLDHASAGKVEAELRGRGVEVEASYGARVTLTLTTGTAAGDDPNGLVGELTGGAVEAVRGDTRWRDVALP
ncbi:MAG: IMPACT family protein [Mycobacteriaceae bacterium]